MVILTVHDRFKNESIGFTGNMLAYKSKVHRLKLKT